jgi:hypothetical protein
MGESFAGTGKTYVELQVREKNGKIHVQGIGEGGNRSYGVADDFPITDGVSKYTLRMPATLESLAGTCQKYVPVQARARKGYVHFQQAGPEGNREYGYSFDILKEQAPALWNFLANAQLDE